MHFTYQSPSSPDLQQGDILAKTDPIKEILKEVHPHYLKDNYTNFIVLTQSCDLVRRNGRRDDQACNARYLSLSVVRPLEIPLRREIAKYQSRLARAGELCKRSVKERVKQFVEKLLNNNETELFYLHEEPSYGLVNNSCAFLRLSISVQTRLHYDACCNARSLSLSPVFQAKLGWLTGNMYSRVGTEDWPDHYDRDEFGGVVMGILDGWCRWEDDERIKEAERRMRDNVDGMDLETVRRLVSDVEVKTRKDRAIDKIIAILRNNDMIKLDREEDRMRKTLANDPELASLLPK